jgi:hypothetical protein
MIKRVAMFLLATVAGYIAMVILITVVQEGIFGGVRYQTTPLLQLLIAGVLTTASAVVGGAVAAWVFGKPWFLAGLGICGLVMLETTYMISTNQLDGPLWFDVMAAGSLVLGILVGVFVVQRLKQRAPSAAAVA